MYHAVGERAPTYWGPASREELYFIDFQTFDEQMQYLFNNDFQAITVEGLLQWFKGERALSKKTVLITFDDGYWSHFIVAYPRLKRYGFKGTFFITVEKIGQQGMLDWENIRVMHEAGMEIGSHGMTHTPLTELPKQKLRYELETSRLVLSDVLKKTVRTIAVPGGFVNKEVRNMAEWTGYDAMCVSEAGYIRQNTDPYMLSRFAIRRDTTMQEFKRIVEGDPLLERKKKMSQGIFRGIKRIIGVGPYERIKQKYFGWRNRT